MTPFLNLALSNLACAVAKLDRACTLLEDHAETDNPRKLAEAYSRVRFAQHDVLAAQQMLNAMTAAELVDEGDPRSAA